MWWWLVGLVWLFLMFLIEGWRLGCIFWMMVGGWWVGGIVQCVLVVLVIWRIHLAFIIPSILLHPRRVRHHRTRHCGGIEGGIGRVAGSAIHVEEFMLCVVVHFVRHSYYYELIERESDASPIKSIGGIDGIDMFIYGKNDDCL